MFSVLFATIGSFIEEISSSITKFETDHNKESIYTAGFINMLFGTVTFATLALFRGSFIFSLASLPIFALRAVLEIVQAQMSMVALMKADRSTFAFVRNLTIPLLLMVDVVLGFSITRYQWIGIAVILGIMAVITALHILNSRGAGYAVFTAVNAVATISLFKYNVTYFNSVEAEQLLIYIILLAYFFVVSRFWAKENPFQFLKKRIFFGQGVFYGAAAVLESFAIALGAPGIAIAAKRASAVLAGIISGHNYFQEKKFGAKLIVCAVLIVGLMLLVY